MGDDMVKFLKDGKIVVLLQGRYAGKKAVILKTNDDGGKERPYGHCVVAGVAKAPLPITKAMCKPTEKMKKLVQRRSRVKTFVKIVNYTHVMPTRSCSHAPLRFTDFYTRSNTHVPTHPHPPTCASRWHSHGH